MFPADSLRYPPHRDGEISSLSSTVWLAETLCLIGSHFSAALHKNAPASGKKRGATLNMGTMALLPNTRTEEKAWERELAQHRHEWSR